MKKLWRLWAKTLGSKIDTDRVSDVAAILRTIWVAINLITCVFIIISAGRNLGLW